MKRWATVPLLLFALLVLGPAVAYGQGATTASISGRVTDADGEPLPGANVLAVHVPSGTRYGVSTGESGRYTLANLRVGGPYRVTASFVGYQSKREEGITLNLGQTRQLNFQLQEQTAELEEVQVVAKQGGVLSSEREGIATNISTEEIESQPTMGRKIADITRLVPQSYVANSDDDGAAISIGQQNTDFNSIYIDGAVSNDVFGLSAQGTDGGQSGATPISLSAVEQVSVDVSPFTVTKSGFTGGAINLVTKSGTNEYKGTFEYYRRSSNLTQSSLTFRGNKIVDGLPSAPDNRFVGSLGGPIIKDKLFFFVNVDIRRSEDGLPAQTPFLGQQLGVGGQNPNQDDPNELDQLGEVRDFMIRNTGYDPGVPGDKASTLDANKFLAKIDYNVSSNHRLTARYYFNDNDNRDRFQSTQEGVNFSNTAEVFPNTQHNMMLQWNASFGKNVASKTTATYKNVVDDRAVQGEPFPHISVDDGPRATFELGSELFSRPNYLEQNVATFSNQTDVFLGDHTLTVGTHNEFYSIDNRFAVFGPGFYIFNSVSNFAETVCHYAQVNQGQFGINGPGPICQAQYPNPKPQTNVYLRQYSLLDDNPNTPEFESLANDNTNLRSEFSAVKLGFYAQDQWQVSDRFRLTFGLRADIPKILDDPQKAQDANTGTLYGTNLGASEFDGPPVSEFYNLKGARAGKMPDWRVFWSPRAGFNYALDEERTTQIRAGTGVYTSRLPFVWPGGAYLNDGVSSDFLTGLNVVPDFVPIPRLKQSLPLRRPENALTRFDLKDSFGLPDDLSVDDLRPTGNLYVFRDDFSYPRIWRTSVAIDRQLPFGLVGTVEGQYSNQLQDIVVRNVNLKQPNAHLDGPDNRPIYRAGQYPDGSKNVDGRYNQIFLLDNTTRGYSYELTARLQKQTTEVWEGGTVRGSASYTYGDARSVNTYGGDTVGSLWDENEHVYGTNNLTLGRSAFSLGHQVNFSLAYRQEITDNVATNLSLYYSGSSGRPFSYTIGGNAAEALIGDEGGAPLFYVPQSVSQFTLTPITDDDGNVLRTVAEQRQDLSRFISNVEYLNTNRGEYTERNGDRTPFEGVVDLKFSVDFTGELVGRNQRLSLKANVFNFSSLLGDIFGTDWGYRYSSVGSFDVVEYAGTQDPDGDGNPTPVYQSALGVSEGNIIRDKKDIFDLRTTGTTYSSLWQMQLGIEYSF